MVGNGYLGGIQGEDGGAVGKEDAGDAGSAGSAASGASGGCALVRDESQAPLTAWFLLFILVFPVLTRRFFPPVRS